jgi:uncharacterized protein (DUF1684 family)
MSLTLLGWRREVARIYAEARAAAEPHKGWLAWRDGRDRLFATHPDSPLGPTARAGFGGLPVGEYDPEMRFQVPVQAAEPLHIDVPTATDGTVPFDRIGLVRLPGLGSLDVWWLGSYGGGVFLPLRDRSAGRTSYGGGRYLLDTVKGADLGGAHNDADGLVVDLNFAYHPSCAYDAAWVCPLAQPGNVLDTELRVGEQLPHGGWYAI